jgi:hypothetical protein
LIYDTETIHSMFNIPVDAWYAWIGLSIAGITLIGAVSGLPTTKPPDAAAVATTIDRVGAAEYPATAEHPLTADAIRLGTYRIGLKSDAGTAHATLAFGPVTPVFLNRITHMITAFVIFCMAHHQHTSLTQKLHFLMQSQLPKRMERM